MTPTSIYVCGWALGLVAIRHFAFRTWKNPVARSETIPFRASFAVPRGLLVLFLVSFMFWWLFVVCVPAAIIEDRMWRPADEDNDSEDGTP